MTVMQRWTKALQVTTMGKSGLIGKEILSEHFELLVASECFVAALFGYVKKTQSYFRRLLSAADLQS